MDRVSFRGGNETSNYRFRIRHGRSDAGRVARRRVGGSHAPRAPLGAQGVGGVVRPAEDDAPVAARQPDGPVAVPALRLPLRPPVPPAVDQFIPKGP